MKIAALYDIHGNLPALDAVLREIAGAGIDRIVIGGDVVPGPMCSECLAAISSLPIPVDCIRGNCEHAMLQQMSGYEPHGLPESARDAMRWVGRQLTPEQIEWISGWLPSLTLQTDVGDVLFCHATPRDDNEIFTRLTPEEHLQSVFSGVGAGTVICGHTHMQFDRMISSVRIVNAGSVGMPFGSTGAFWLLIDTAIELRRTTYDLDDAARLIRSGPYPQAQEFAERYVLRPPSEEEILNLYARVEIGRA
jgi:predicted phosphodiesterase